MRPSRGGLIERVRAGRAGGQRLMVEDSARLKGLLDLRISRGRDVLDERRGADDGIRFQEKGGGHKPLRRQRHQVVEGGARAVQARLLSRPAQLAQDGWRVEDAAAGEIGPFTLDEARQLHVVEVAEAGAGAVDQVHAAIARRGAKVWASIQRRHTAAVSSNSTGDGSKRR